MGHRALIAYERPNGKYNIHYSHNGGLHLRLKCELTPETPFGEESGSDDVHEYFAELLDMENGTNLDSNLSFDNLSRTAVELDPLACNVPFEDLLMAHLDFLHYEALYVVNPDFDISAYRTLWFGLEYDCESITESQSVGNGALRTVRWHDGKPINDGYIQGEFGALKSIVGDLIDRDVFSVTEATEYMTEKLAQWTVEHEDLIFQIPE
ncbi:hypothetical protein OB905_14105 [Halobacteria archaeon AArc-dxtr1]|nr:hypothetical protein [Halobacteria archaeon AArc-dxtr1]